jgi:hypothetical protein
MPEGNANGPANVLATGFSRTSEVLPPGKSVQLDKHDQSNEPTADCISDAQFEENLDRLRELRSFVLDDAIEVEEDKSDALKFGRLNNLKCRSDGRPPTEEEWCLLEDQMQKLFRLLPQSERRKFKLRLSGIPRMLVYLSVIFGIVALVLLVLTIILPYYIGATAPITDLGAKVAPLYLLWLMCIGAIGAIASIGMSALSVQEDQKFDITNWEMVMLRIALGGLFGLVLTLPFGFNSFMQLCYRMVKWSAESQGTDTSIATQTNTATQAALLLLPFVVGFSTSLVITVLDRLREAIETIFGRKGASSPP